MTQREADRYAAYAAAQMIESCMGSGALCAWDQPDVTGKDEDRVRAALVNLIDKLRERGQSTSLGTPTQEPA